MRQSNIKKNMKLLINSGEADSYDFIIDIVNNMTTKEAKELASYLLEVMDDISIKDTIISLGLDEMYDFDS
jgi:hypothetical protein